MHRCGLRTLILTFGLALLAAAAAGRAEERDEVRARRDGDGDVTWRAATSPETTVSVRLLGINDLHGQLEQHLHAQGREGSRPIGGAAVLASYLEAERSAHPGRTLTLIAGDSIGASAIVSGLLRDEPTMAILDELADGDCPPLAREWAARAAPAVTRCHLVATVGNHEFDRGTAELERLLYGGHHPDGPLLGHDWAGIHVPYVVANVVRRDGQQPLLPASVIVDLHGVRIGVVGAVTAETPALVVPERIRDLQFLPEVAPINAAVAALRAAGVRAVVLLIHEGLQAPQTPQPAPLAADELRGRLADVLRGLDGGIDVVVGGHTHKPNNVLVPLKDGSLALVTQALSYGTAYSSIDLLLDARTGAVVAKSARIVTTWADEGPGRDPVRKVARIVEKSAKATAAIGSRLIGSAESAIRRGEPTDPESPLGNFVADAQRAIAGTDLAFMNASGLRNDLEAGPITFAMLYDVHPFGNTLVRLTLTGEQVLRLLEQQWSGPHAETPRFLRVSGLRYVYDLSKAAGQRIVAIDDARGEALDPARRYSAVANDFIVGGGDHYSVLAEGAGATPLMTDIAALEAYIRRAPAPVKAALDGRVRPFADRARPVRAAAQPAVIGR
jgi:5'-nucleotidase